MSFRSTCARLALACTLLGSLSCGRPVAQLPVSWEHPANQVLLGESLREAARGGRGYLVARLAGDRVDRVAGMLDLTGADATIGFEFRARPTSGSRSARSHDAWSDWAPLPEVWREGALAVLVADLPGPSQEVELRLPRAQAGALGRLDWSVFRHIPEPGATPGPGLASVQQPLISAASAIGVRSRSSWGAAGRRCGSWDASKYRMAIHHTVSPDTYGGTVEGRLRQIQSFHQDGRGWCDIGYHYLISSDGQIWEGREHNYLGTHVGYNNTGNIGISYMGCFHPSGCGFPTDPVPPEAMIDAGGLLVGALAEHHGITITGSSVKGHRDHSGASTACPGDHLHARLPDIRSIAIDGGDPPCTDSDGDGVCVEEGDCDDGRSSVGPGFPETCDGRDNDCDGSVDEGLPDADGDGVSACLGDCDDSDPLRTPGRAELCSGRDDDCDGSVDEGFDSDGDGFRTCDDDCDDSIAQIHPGASELCDARDNDCDGFVDEDFDFDGDGAPACAGDCDESNPYVHPGAPEACDGVDNDCDGDIDEDIHDLDGDGWSPCDGDCADNNDQVWPGAPEVCDAWDNDCDRAIDEGLPDTDGDGFSVCWGDCDDADPFRFPDQVESCNGVDDDCDGIIDDEQVDLDGDGRTACGWDCDDTEPTVWLGAFEACDGLDNDCNGLIDDAQPDLDEDGFSACEGDCDDLDPTRQPWAQEACNGVDDNCDGALLGDEQDRDGDGVWDCEGDCDDRNPEAYPFAPELCDGIDNDCDLSPGEDEIDQDGDGVLLCDRDCDDLQPNVYPGAPELCDGLDDDCDGVIGDEELDQDGDGAPACDDCDDTDPTIVPWAEEICDDLIDQDCDGEPGRFDDDCEAPAGPTGCGCQLTPQNQTRPGPSAPAAWGGLATLLLGWAWPRRRRAPSRR